MLTFEQLAGEPTEFSVGNAGKVFGLNHLVRAVWTLRLVDFPSRRGLVGAPVFLTVLRCWAPVVWVLRPLEVPVRLPAICLSPRSKRSWSARETGVWSEDENHLEIHHLTYRPYTNAMWVENTHCRESARQHLHLGYRGPG